MKNRILVLASIAALMIGATIFAAAQEGRVKPPPPPPRADGPPPPEDMLTHISRELNLNDVQKMQVKAIFDAERAATDPLQAKSEEIHKQIEATVVNGQFDEAQVRTLAGQAGQLNADMMVEHIRAHTKIFSILTPEQRVKAMEMHKRMGPGGPHGSGRPMGGRPNGPPPPPEPQQ
ncbi:MAG TPA: Spy/CpxP family protein refolding chaperone [Pyrinomonadaceae bacterium]